jgi:F-type H+-transporting ATPase subunit b
VIFLSILARAASSPSLLDGLGVNLFAFLSQLISFGIVVAVLGYFGLPTIQKTLEQRRKLIQEGVENAARAKRDLVDATAHAEQILRDARIQGQEAIAQASKVAEKEAQRIYEDAQARAAQIEQQQVERIRQEAARARAELSRLVVNLSIGAASKVISKSVDTKDNRRMVEEFVTASEAKVQ